MILERPFLLFVFPATFIALAIIFAGFQVSMTIPFVENFNDQPIATLAGVKGHVELSRQHTSRASQLPQSQKLDLSLFNFDKIQTHFGSETRVQFLDGYELSFSPRSLFVLEQWSPEENQGPIYVNLIAGDFKVKSKGRPGSLYIVQRGEIFDPNRKPKGKIRYLTVQSKTGLEANLSNPNHTKASPSKVVLQKPKQKSSLLSSLSNQYIDQTISKNKERFIKCQSHAIRKNKSSKGQLLVGISIDPRGRMKDVRILASDLENTELQKCVQSVLNRTKFRPFNGPEIVRSYPIVFE